jgi:HAAS domain-containing protein
MTMASKADKLVADYLKRLNAELRSLPRARRRELADEISAHIAEARADLERDDEMSIRTLLDRLGDPEDIAAEATERFGGRPKPSGWKEVGALILLPIGGILLPVFGWVVGVFLLWISDAWNTRDKLIGTLLFPGGLLLPLGLGVVAEGSGGCDVAVGSECPPDSGGSNYWQLALVAVLVIVPLATTVYLAHRRGRTAAVA